MTKRSLPDGDEEMDVKAPFGQRHIGEGGDVEMGEFEDPWEDEFEEDEEIVEGAEYEDEDDDERNLSL